MVLLSSVAAIVMATLVIIVRIKAAKKPATLRKIILPPIFMSTGSLMFLFPMFQVTPLQVIEAVSVGAIFSIFLIKTSQFEVRENEIYLKRSKAFIFILFGLLILRIILKSLLSATIDVGELSGMFYLLALGMIIPWRVAMFLSFKKLNDQLIQQPTI
ncbi:membrane protein CcdC involved in cytochrome C biogenesis [Bacillus mesophilus]|uniref:Cytochrome c biogenesis protein CcdC n=1 Tax=Bacillus mesophilus TaxID=1808955 RepID=A0A6M0Q1G1_9BACI|nr:cytochrome c biogenesis protein CcdC [Bacillus mesophilus]MBM7659251.1 membrane protein CcdC involved in cytochrome C biogenesis [Bacillus mesophilus]NEY70125.1 cytochrome c biogenesis protein CcdC [Bacillus mesophilus]